MGLDKDYAAALLITSDQAISDPTAMVSVLKDATEKIIKNSCGRDL